MMKIFLPILAVVAIASAIYVSRANKQERAQKEASLVTRAERIVACRETIGWIPDVGDPVQISIDDSRGIVVFVAFGGFENFEFSWLSRKVDSKECDVFGIDVRTNTTRVIETTFEGQVDRTVEPYAVVRFLPAELSPVLD